MSINYSFITKTMGSTLIVLSLFMLPCLGLAFLWQENTMISSFLLTVIILASVGVLLRKKVIFHKDRLRTRDMILAVASVAIAAVLSGTLPYLFSGSASSTVNALFESVSGFTTTGATSFHDVEALPRSLLFWRSLTHWIGALGLIMLTASFHPIMGMHDHSLGTSETPDSSISQTSLYWSHTMKILYGVYFSLTLLCIAALLLSGTTLFDAVTFAFSSMSTGGFTPYNNGVLHLNNPVAEWILSFFSVVACINFTMYFLLVKKRFSEFFKNVELRIFLGIMAVASLLIIWNLHANGTFQTFGDTFRYGLFQTISFLTTTGNCNYNYYEWPEFSKMLLFSLAFIGGCAASTCGGIKVSRILILFKMIWRGFHRRVHPNAIYSVKIQGRLTSFDVVSNVTTFVSAYFGFFLLGCLVLSFENQNILTTISASASMLGNLGTGFGAMGITGDYSMFSSPSKLFMAFEMLAGRLELFIILILFSPRFWNPDK